MTDSTNRAPDFSLIIPCYCEEPFLRKNTLELVNLLQLAHFSSELVFVEDGSSDGTAEVLRSLSAELDGQGVPHQVVWHERNWGRGAAVKSGVRQARGTVAGFIDIDLENLPDAILPMYGLVSSGELDLVVGRRITTGKDLRPLRRITHLAYRWLIHLVASPPVSDTETGLKIFSREKILPLLPLTPNDHWFWDTEIVLKSVERGLKIGEHPVIFLRNTEKASTVKVVRDSLEYLVALCKYRIGN